MAEELQELKDRLADLSGALDELIARQKAQQAADPPPPPSPSEPSPPPPSATPEP